MLHGAPKADVREQHERTMSHKIVTCVTSATIQFLRHQQLSNLFSRFMRTKHFFFWENNLLTWVVSIERQKSQMQKFYERKLLKPPLSPTHSLWHTIRRAFQAWLMFPLLTGLRITYLNWDSAQKSENWQTIKKASMPKDSTNWLMLAWYTPTFYEWIQ